MPNLIVLCHRCLTWVEPQWENCSECGAEVNLEKPDPDREVLEKMLGTPLTVLGPVQLERRGLPSYGYLIGTTSGLLFLPRLHRQITGAWEGVTSQALPGWWPFRGDLSSPRFLNWLRRPLGIVVPDEKTEMMGFNQETESLADRLLDSPGALFIEHRFIRGFQPRRRTIKIERMPLRSVTIIDETDEATILGDLRSLSTQAAWKIAPSAL